MVVGGCRSGRRGNTWAMMPCGARGGGCGCRRHGRVLCATGCVGTGTGAEKALLVAGAGAGGAGGGAAGCEGGAWGATTTEHFFGVLIKRERCVGGGGCRRTRACGYGESFLVEKGFEFGAGEGMEVVEVVF